MGKMTFGLIGAGAIAQTWAQAIEKSSCASLEAVADHCEEAAAALAEGYGCPAYRSYQKMVGEKKLDAVVICTPPVTHPEISIFCLGEKKHVICEKPFSIRGEDAQHMCEAAEKAGALITMASKFRYVEDVVRAKSIVQSGILGDIVLFENVFASRIDMSGRWNANPQISGGGVLIDNGTHSLDIIRYYLGPIKDIEVVEGRRIQGLPVEETVLVFIHTESGVMGSIDLSWSINKEFPSYINIYGTYGSISVGWKESKYRQLSSPEWVVFGKGYGKVDAFVRQLENFCRAARGEEKLVITSEDAVASVKAVEAGYKALGKNKWTNVQL
jgi:predicted dehydrogenase